MSPDPAVKRKLPRLVDMIGPDRPERMSRRRRAFVTQDGNAIVQGESYPIAGDPIAMDARPHVEPHGITFDGAVPPSDESADR